MQEKSESVSFSAAFESSDLKSSEVLSEFFEVESKSESVSFGATFKSSDLKSSEVLSEFFKAEFNFLTAHAIIYK